MSNRYIKWIVTGVVLCLSVDALSQNYFSQEYEEMDKRAREHAERTVKEASPKIDKAVQDALRKRQRQREKEARAKQSAQENMNSELERELERERKKREREELERQKQQHIQQVENTAYNREMQKSESSYNQSKRMDSWRAGKEMLQGMQAFAKSNNDYVALPDNSTDPSLGSSNSSNRRKSGLENLKTQSGLEKKGQEPQPPKKRTPKECWEAFWQGESLSPEEMDLVNEYNTRK